MCGEKWLYAYYKIQCSLRVRKDKLPGHEKIFIGRKSAFFFLNIVHLAAPVGLGNEGVMRNARLYAEGGEGYIGLRLYSLINIGNMRIKGTIFLCERVKTTIGQQGPYT